MKSSNLINAAFLFQSFVVVSPLFARAVSETDQINEHEQQNNHDVPLDVDAYLGKYGYLHRMEPDPLIRASYSEFHRNHAIKLFQKFVHLPQTGEINKETISAMKRPRCGFEDINSISDDPKKPLEYNAGPSWNEKTVRWKILKFSNKLTKTEQRLAIENSFRHWSDVSGLVAEATDGDNADINIEFLSGSHGDGDAFDGKGRVLGHAFLPPDGRAHFDDDEDWVFHNTNGTEFEIVATHEIGHSLGLSHSTVRGSMMSPFYRKYEHGYALHADDILGIQSLYGAPTPRSTFAAPAAEVTTQQSVIELDNSLCSAKFDAITTGPGGHIHLFIGKKVYKLPERCEEGHSCVIHKYPQTIRRVFKNGPRRVSAAAFVPDYRQQTYLFQGRKVWRYTGYILDKGYPHTMTKSDLPYRPTAAYVQKNQFADYQLYLFGGKYFWELNLYTEKMANGKMKSNTYWDFMPRKPDAITQTKDGHIYVFKGDYYNRYDHARAVVEKKRRKAPAWIGGECGFSDKLHIMANTSVGDN